MTDMIVSGAGTTAVNGTYIETGTYGGKPLYIYGSYSIGWDYNEMYGTGWHITSSLGYGYGYYWAGDNVSTPDLVTTWAGDWGEPPMPVVTAASSSQNLTLTCAAGSYSLTGTNVTLTATVKQNLTQAYDRIIATITTASDASQVVKAMVKSTEWREGTSGTWLSTDCTLKAGKVYQFRTPLSGMSSDTTAILPNIKASVTVAWDTTATPITSVGDYFMYAYAYGCTSLTSLSVPDTSGLTSVGTYFMYYYARGCSSLTSLSVPDTSGLTSVGDYFMYYYASGCSSLTSLSVPDTSGLTSVGDYFMALYAYDCTSLTSLSVPDTSGLTSVGTYFMSSYADGCSSLTSLSVPDTSGLTSVGDYFMYYYAYGCSSLTSLSVPDTSGLTSVGANFMRYYAINCSSLTSLMLPSATGWFESHNISWSVPSSRLNYLYGYAPNATSQTAWQALTVSGKTLYTNYIQSSSYVKVIEAKLPKFFLYYARMRGN